MDVTPHIGIAEGEQVEPADCRRVLIRASPRAPSPRWPRAATPRARARAAPAPGPRARQAPRLWRHRARRNCRDPTRRNVGRGGEAAGTHRAMKPHRRRVQDEPRVGHRGSGRFNFALHTELAGPEEVALFAVHASARAKRLMDAVTTAPPSSVENGGTSVHAPAKSSRTGAAARATVPDARCAIGSVSRVHRGYPSSRRARAGSCPGFRAR